jgi:hypothetical protein
MDVFIYASPGFGRPRDELEDAIENFLGYKGAVTGSGAGQSGSNIDIEVFNDGSGPEWIVEGLRKILRDFDSPRDAKIVIDRVEYPLYP